MGKSNNMDTAASLADSCAPPRAAAANATTTAEKGKKKKIKKDDSAESDASSGTSSSGTESSKRNESTTSSVLSGNSSQSASDELHEITAACRRALRERAGSSTTTQVSGKSGAPAGSNAAPSLSATLSENCPDSSRALKQQNRGNPSTAEASEKTRTGDNIHFVEGSQVMASNSDYALPDSNNDGPQGQTGKTNRRARSRNKLRTSETKKNSHGSMSSASTGSDSRRSTKDPSTRPSRSGLALRKGERSSQSYKDLPDADSRANETGGVRTPRGGQLSARSQSMFEQSHSSDAGCLMREVNNSSTSIADEDAMGRAKRENPPDLPQSTTPRSARRLGKKRSSSSSSTKTAAWLKYANPLFPEDWRISSSDKALWQKEFNELLATSSSSMHVNQHAFASESKVKSFDKVYRIADQDCDELLSESEFVLCSWLLRLVAYFGDELVLPDVIPARLLHSAGIPSISEVGEATSPTLAIDVQILQDMVAPAESGGLDLITVQFDSRPASRCCSGANVLSWLIAKEYAQDRTSAIEIASMLVQRRILTPLLRDKHAARAFAKGAPHEFRDDTTPYQLFSSISQKAPRSRSGSPAPSALIDLEPQKPHCRIAVFGEHDVGKSSLVHRFHQKAWAAPLTQSPASAELGGAKIHQSRFQLGDSEILIETLDPPPVSGTDHSHDDIFNKWTEWGDVFVLCYSTTSRPSFDAVPELFTRIVALRKFRLTPFVLVGLKIDLRVQDDDGEEIPVEKFVSADEGQQLAQRYRCPFIEASSKTGAMTRDVFNLAIDALRSVEFMKSGSVDRSGWAKLRSEGKPAKKRFMTVTNSGIRFFSDKPKSSTDTGNLKLIVRMDGLEVSLFRPYKASNPRQARPGSIGKRRIQLATLRRKPTADRIRRLSDADQGNAPRRVSSSSSIVRSSTMTSISKAAAVRGTSSVGSSPASLSPVVHAKQEPNLHGTQKEGSTHSPSSSSSHDTSVWLRDVNSAIHEVIFASSLEQEEWFSFITRCIEHTNLPRDTEEQARNVASSETTAETTSTFDDRDQSTASSGTVTSRPRPTGAIKPRRASTLRNPRRSKVSSEGEFVPEIERARRITVGELADSEPARSPLRSSRSTDVSVGEITAMSDWEDADTLTVQRIGTLVREFNRKPLKAVIRMLELGLFGDGEPEDIAEFLANPGELFNRLQRAAGDSGAAHVDRVKLTAVGEFLGGHGSLCTKVRVQFAKLFNVDGMDFEEALRAYLEKFTLPREAQMIDRIVESFAAHFCEKNPEAFSNPDVGYILMFSIIMLNTDAHNDQVKTKMTLEEFVRNNRGIDGGKDVDRKILERIYLNVKQNEIKMQFERADFDSWEKQGWIKVYSSKCKEGTLRGKGKQKHEPVPFWVIVSNNSLWLFTEPQGKDPLFIVPLSNLKISSYSGSERHEFRLLSNEAKGKIRAASRGDAVMLTDLHLYFEDRTTKYEWILALQHNVVAAPTYGV